MDDEARGHLHAVLRYLQNSEAKRFYERPDEQQGHVYADALWLIRRFRFYDLMKDDRWCRGQLTREEEEQIKKQFGEILDNLPPHEPGEPYDDEEP